MPFEQPDRLLTGPTGGDPYRPPPDLSGVPAAAFRLENPIVSALAHAHGLIPAEPGYTPATDPQFTGTDYERNYRDRFLGSRSPAETAMIRTQIDREVEDRKITDAAGLYGTIMEIAAGTLDPTMLLPAGSVVRAVRGGVAIGRSAARVGLAAGAQAAVQETALQLSQETRTPEQSAVAVGTATLLGSFIGGGAAALLSRTERKVLTESLDHTRTDIDAHAGNVVDLETARAARAESAGESADAGVRGSAPESGGTLAASAGAAATDTRTLDLDVVGRTLPQVSPTRRTMVAESIPARRTMADLAEMPYRFLDNEGGVATTQGPALERLARMEVTGARVAVSDEIWRQFAEYRFGQPDITMPVLRAQAQQLFGSGEPGKLSPLEFKREVAKAVQNAGQHDIPQVAAAAQFVQRRVFDPWGARGEKAVEGFKPISPQEGEAYFPHIWNKEKVRARRPAFTNRLVDRYKADQEQKASAKARMAALADDMEAFQKRLAKAKSEEDAAVAQARIDALRTRLEEEIAAWEGKSVADAKSAIKAREKYRAEAEAEGQTPGEGGRLEGADTAIDRAVRRIIESDRDLDDAELRAVASQTVDRILGSPDGRLPYDLHTGGPRIGFHDGPPPRGPLAGRQLNVSNDWAREWIEDDIEHVVAMYLRTMVPDVLLAEKFGDVEMSAAMREVLDDYSAKIDATTSEKTAKRLGDERDRVIRDLAAVRDRIRSVYGWSGDLRNMARVAQGAKAVNNLTSMGMSAISSLPDMAGVVFRHGITTALGDGWAPFFRGLTGADEGAFAKFKSQVRAFGIGVETAINARQHAIDDVMDAYRPQTKFERTLQAANDKFFIANLQAPQTDVVKTVAAHVAVSEILRASAAVRAGKATKRQVTDLASAGIDGQMATRIAEQFETGGAVENGVHLPNTADWTDQAAASALNGAVAREVDIAVVTPGQEKPLWLSHPVFSLLGQFKSFVAASHERILIANLQRRDAQVLQGLITSLALGMLSYKLNAMTGGQKTSDRPQDWFKEAVSRSGLMGWFEEGNALAAKATRGSADVWRLAGADKPLSRYASRSALDMFLGPTAGKLDSMLKVTGAAGTLDWNEGDTKAFRRLIAGQNLLYTRQLFDQVEAGANGAFGIEMKAR